METSLVDHIDNDRVWTKGDFEVVTSDNIRFRFPSSFLLYCTTGKFIHSRPYSDISTAIREMHEMNPVAKKTLTLCDPDFETSNVFRRFLQLAQYGDLFEPIDHPSLLGLACSIKKWDCHATESIFLCLLRDKVRTGAFSPLTTFIPAAELGCINTCMIAIDSPPRYWTDDGDDDQACGDIGCNTLNPSSWPIEDPRRVTVSYQ